MDTIVNEILIKPVKPLFSAMYLRKNFHEGQNLLNRSENRTAPKKPKVL